MFCKTDIAEKRRHGTLLCVGLQVLSRHRIPKFRVPQKVMFSSNGLNENPGRNCPENGPRKTPRNCVGREWNFPAVRD